MPKFKDLSAQRFGRLVAEAAIGSNKHGAMTWRCSCACGNTVTVVGFQLLQGKTKSCGCLRVSVGQTSNRSHGLSLKDGAPTPTYRAWVNMLSRCYNENVRSYAIYGAKGVRVCDRWRASFKAFYEDMGEKPSGKSLDRRDGSLNYEPTNCRWATSYEQSANRSRPSNNSSGFKNVTCRRGKWIVQVRANRKTVYSGTFDDLELAALVAEEARNKFHEQFANHR